MRRIANGDSRTVNNAKERVEEYRVFSDALKTHARERDDLMREYQAALVKRKILRLKQKSDIGEKRDSL